MAETGDVEGEGLTLRMAEEVEMAELCRLWVDTGMTAGSIA